MGMLWRNGLTRPGRQAREATSGTRASPLDRSVRPDRNSPSAGGLPLSSLGRDRVGQAGDRYLGPLSRTGVAMSTSDIVLLSMAVLAAIIVVAAATEGQWIAVGVFSLTVVSSLVMLLDRRRRRSSEE